MLPHEGAIEALGAMIWCVTLFALHSRRLNFRFWRYLHTLNIDKDILSMKNFNVYDPMKRGQSLVLDGQTLAHIEVGLVLEMAMIRVEVLAVHQVLQNSEGSEEGTLLRLLSRCITPSGTDTLLVQLAISLTHSPQANVSSESGFAPLCERSPTSMRVWMLFKTCSNTRHSSLSSLRLPRVFLTLSASCLAFMRRTARSKTSSRSSR